MQSDVKFLIQTIKLLVIFSDVKDVFVLSIFSSQKLINSSILPSCLSFGTFAGASSMETKRCELKSRTFYQALIAESERGLAV